MTQISKTVVLVDTTTGTCCGFVPLRFASFVVALIYAGILVSTILFWDFARMKGNAYGVALAATICVGLTSVFALIGSVIKNASLANIAAFAALSHLVLSSVFGIVFYWPQSLSALKNQYEKYFEPKSSKLSEETFKLLLWICFAVVAIIKISFMAILLRYAQKLRVIEQITKAATTPVLKKAVKKERYEDLTGRGHVV